MRQAGCIGAALLLAASLGACGSTGASASSVPVEQLVPKEINGSALTLRTAAPNWTEQLTPDSGTIRIATLLDLTKDDIYSAGAVGDRPNGSPGTTASTVDIVWTGFRGASPDRILRAWVSWVSAACPTCTVTEMTIGGRKGASAIVKGATSPALYAYASGDILYEITAHDASLAEEAIAKLP